MSLLKRFWVRWNVQRHHGGDREAMQRLYLFEDPWGLNRDEEQVRFVETVRIIRKQIGEHFRSILEIGCGEGLQTHHLAPLADEITGIDPSEQAIKRAVDRGIENARFEVGDIRSYQQPKQYRFDLVTACEVLYYFENLEEVYRTLSWLGRNCLVTYYKEAAERLDPFFRRRAVHSTTIGDSTDGWRVVWWQNL